jgi:16S rRNA (cytidine1402-2'-O)-methyltransferase
VTPGRLVVCPTPIGNLDDVTPRVLAALGDADVVACEDTRRTRVLLDRHGVRAQSLVSYHEHNERARAAELVERMLGGEVVALVSDAGMPAVSDPGWVVVRACADAGVRVEVLPGPSAVDVALVASALPADRWAFVGFLPRRAGELSEVWAAPTTVVAFESPRRLAGSLASLARADPGREVAVCRELTKVHEEVVRGTAAELAARYAADAPRGEIVVVVAPAPAGAGDEERAVAALEALVEAGARVRPAAAVVAELTGVAANRLYRRVAASSGPPGRSGV